MFTKILIACALVAMCKAGHEHHTTSHHSHHIVHPQHHEIHHEEPHHEFHHHEEPEHHEIHHDHHDHHEEIVDEHAYPKYEYKYSVEDPHTGDYKNQHETRDGDSVKGEYSLLQPDGSFRTVHYVADHHSGFHADVHNTAPVHHHHHD